MKIYAASHTANDRYSGIKSPDRFSTIAVVACICPLISSGYDSTDEENDGLAASRARSVPPQSGQVRSAKSQDNILGSRNFSPNHLRAVSEADLLRSHGESEDYQRGGGGRRPRSRTSRTSRRSSSHDRLDGKSESSVENQDHLGLYGGGRLGGRNEPKLRHRTASQLSVARQVWSIMQSAFVNHLLFYILFGGTLCAYQRHKGRIQMPNNHAMKTNIQRRVKEAYGLRN